MSKPPIVHKDIFNRELIQGSTVAYPSSNSLVIGTILKCNPRMLTVSQVGSRGTCLKYPNDVILVDGPHVTMYMLRNSK